MTVDHLIQALGILAVFAVLFAYSAALVAAAAYGGMQGRIRWLLAVFAPLPVGLVVLMTIAGEYGGALAFAVMFGGILLWLGWTAHHEGYL